MPKELKNHSKYTFPTYLRAILRYALLISWSVEFLETPRTSYGSRRSGLAESCFTGFDPCPGILQTVSVIARKTLEIPPQKSHNNSGALNWNCGELSLIVHQLHWKNWKLCDSLARRERLHGTSKSKLELWKREKDTKGREIGGVLLLFFIFVSLLKKIWKRMCFPVNYARCVLRTVYFRWACHVEIQEWRTLWFWASRRRLMEECDWGGPVAVGLGDEP